jgi:hypothetical protein
MVPSLEFTNMAFCLSVMDERMDIRFDLPLIRTGNSMQAFLILKFWLLI